MMDKQQCFDLLLYEYRTVRLFTDFVRFEKSTKKALGSRDYLTRKIDTNGARCKMDAVVIY